MADIAIERKDRPRAMAELRVLLNTDFENLDAAKKLVSVMKADGVTDPAQLRPAYERIAALDPFDADARTMLGRFALQRNDPDAASREFKVVLALNPVDAAVRARRPRGELPASRQAPRSEKGNARGARDRADLRARAGSPSPAGGE